MVLEWLAKMGGQMGLRSNGVDWTTLTGAELALTWHDLALTWRDLALTWRDWALTWLVHSGQGGGPITC